MMTIPNIKPQKPRKTVELRTNSVELRMDNVAEWPEDGNVSFVDLVALGFKPDTIGMWMLRKAKGKNGITNYNMAYPRREYGIFKIKEVKDFLLGRYHAGPGSLNKKEKV